MRPVSTVPTSARRTEEEFVTSPVPGAGEGKPGPSLTNPIQMSPFNVKWTCSCSYDQNQEFFAVSLYHTELNQGQKFDMRFESRANILFEVTHTRIAVHKVTDPTIGRLTR